MFSSIIHNPHRPRIGDEIINLLSYKGRARFCAAVAFAKCSGVGLIINKLRDFVADGGECEFIIGIDQNGTSYEALRQLLDLGNRVHCYINHCRDFQITFHPKLYFAKKYDGTEATVVTGSGNLTRGGLYINDEIAIKQQLDLTRQEDIAFFTSVEQAFDRMKRYDCLELDSQLLERLLVTQEIPRESEIHNQQPHQSRVGEPLRSSTFNYSMIRRCIRDIGTRDRQVQQPHHDNSESDSPTVHDSDTIQGFVMTLMRTDVGHGQTTRGAQARSPEFFIPLVARDHNPMFWGWPTKFVEDPNKRGKFDRRVDMSFNDDNISVSMMTWPDKHDFRLRNAVLRDAANINDILHIQCVTVATRNVYKIEIIHHTDASYNHYYGLCQHNTRNSDKKWGYYTL